MLVYLLSLCLSVRDYHSYDLLKLYANRSVKILFLLFVPIPNDHPYGFGNFKGVQPQKCLRI